MKIITSIIYILAGFYCAFAQIRLEPHQWTAKVTVVDDTGKPVPNAEVQIGEPFNNKLPDGRPVLDNILGKTDTNGIFTVSHTDRAVFLDFYVQKAGYYHFGTQYKLGFSMDAETNWNPSPTIILKKIRNPIPMHAKAIRGIPIPNQPVGYDLMTGDWVAPHGKGTTTDIIFTKTSILKAHNDYESKFTVSFPNQGDGIQVFVLERPPDEGSALRSPYQAPEQGYEPTVVRETSAHPGQISKDEYDRKRNYFFRVRTVLDEQGNVKSALYGKIYGDFQQAFTYFLNPTANDRNIEFDPKRNLIIGEKVPVP